MAYYSRRKRYGRRTSRVRSHRKRYSTRRRVRRVSKSRFVRPSHPRGSASTMRMRPGRILFGKGTGLTAARSKPIDWKLAAQDATRFLNPLGVSVSEWKKLPPYVHALAFHTYGPDVMKNALASVNLKPEHWIRAGHRAYDWAKGMYDTYKEATADPSTFL